MAARICTAVAVGNFCSGYIGGTSVARYRSLISVGVIGIVPGFPGNIAGGLFNTVATSGLILQIASGLLHAVHGLRANPDCDAIRAAAVRLARMDSLPD